MPVTPSTLVTEHLWLSPARCRALGLRRSHSVWDDAVQEGNIGLMKAAERFDSERGVRFESYARLWVDNAIKLCFCAQQIVAEPIKRIARRAASGERAHPVVLAYTEREGSRPAYESACLAASEWAAEGGEEALAEAIDQGRREAWLRARLSELPVQQRVTLLALGREMGPSEFARRESVCRETVRLRTNAGLEYLRREALADELECQ